MIAGGAEWGRVPFAMFTAYFDASGTTHSTERLVMGGFIASADPWVDFEKEWIVRLKKDGLNILHMKELGRWDPIKKQRLIDDLCAIVAAHASYRIAVIVINHKINQHLSGADQKKWHTQAYSYAGRTCAKEVRIWASKWKGPMPELIYEKGDTGQPDLRRLLEGKGGYPNFQFRPKKDHRDKKSGNLIVGPVPLQAADLLAYEVAAWCNRMREEKPKSQREAPRIQKDLHKMDGITGVAIDDYLKFFKDGVKQIDALVMIPNVKIRTR
jgi:hypothetical protein